MKHLSRISAVAMILMSAAAPLQAADEPVAQISVTGQGEISARPDMAIMNFGVEKLAPTAREALDANNEAMNRVIALLKEAGLEDKDIKTTGFSIYPRYNYDNKTNEQPEITGYQVNNAVTAKISDLARLGEILDQAVSAGLNQGGQISFNNSNVHELMNEARAAAVKDALEKARLLAEAAGVEAGKILSINDSGGGFPDQPVPMRAAFVKEDSSVPVESGENTYRVTVNVTMAIGGQ